MPYKDPEKARANARARREKNRAKTLEYERAYREANRTKLYVQHAAWLEANPERARAIASKASAKYYSTHTLERCIYDTLRRARLQVARSEARTQEYACPV